MDSISILKLSAKVKVNLYFYWQYVIFKIKLYLRNTLL